MSAASSLAPFLTMSFHDECDDEEMEKQLLLAASSGNLRLLKEMAKSLDKGEGMAETIKRIKSLNGLCALHGAAAGGKTEICQYLVQELGIPVDFLSQEGRTPLLYAAKEGKSATVSYFIEHGADPTAADKEWSTPLLYAAEFGHVEVIKLLLSKGVPVDPENYRGTPLHQAASHGEKSAMKILLEHGADINNLMNGLMTPLLCCIMTGSLKCTKLLIKAGADLNLRCPLAMTVYQNELEIMKCLLEAGADPNIPNEDENLPIEVAAMGDRKEMLEILFPLTSPIPQVISWSIEGLYIHARSYAFGKKLERMAQKKLVDCKMKGGEAYKRKDFLTAVFFYNAAITRDSTDATLFALRSLCWLKAGYGRQALKDACLAQTLKPNWPKAYYHIGAALMLLEDWEQASQAFLDGLKLDPADEDIKKALKKSLDRMKKAGQ